MAKMIVETILKDNHGNLLYKCTDRSRFVFRYVDNTGKKVKDIRANRLLDTLSKTKIENDFEEYFRPIWAKSENFELYDKYYLSVIRITKEWANKTFISKLADLTT